MDTEYRTKVAKVPQFFNITKKKVYTEYDRGKYELKKKQTTCSQRGPKLSRTRTNLYYGREVQKQNSCHSVEQLEYSL